MHVLVIAEQLRRAAPGGIGTYVRSLVAAVEGEPEITLLASRAPAGGDPVAALGRPVVTSPLPGKLLTRAWGRGLAGVGGSRFDLVFAPSLAAPPCRSVPVAVAVHDVAWRRLPEAYPARGRRWHDRALARAARTAALLIVPSPETADEVVAAGAPASRVEVLDPMYGCDHLPPADGEGRVAALARLGVTGPYLLAVGTLEPRKNLSRLVEAYTRARPFLPDPWPLVLVGPAGWGVEVDALRRVDGVKVAGPVSGAVLASLYAGAVCVAYVPLFEGYGLPAVEAMAAGVPLVASPVPSTAGTALEVDPLDVDAIAAGLVTAASDDRRRAELVTGGLLRASELTWKAAADRHVEAWRAVA
ncbi:MAG TPA: glycosyltransferase family 1 protein [Acidimicrobiales bacterium]|nr:glycosyltransferase family 1 protein [Acidimicrobiales bacterium]